MCERKGRGGESEAGRGAHIRRARSEKGGRPVREMGVEERETGELGHPAEDCRRSVGRSVGRTYEGTYVGDAVADVVGPTARNAGERG